MSAQSDFRLFLRALAFLLGTPAVVNRFPQLVPVVAGAALALCPSPAYGQATPVTTPNTPQEATLTTRATGTFEVKLTPQPVVDSSDGPELGRIAIDKAFHGDLEGTSKGEMLTAITRVQGSAGYVAIEQVSGTLHGRRGTFLLQHSGTMTRGAPHLVITVVPNSGTGQLEGLAGTMTIIIADGKHGYDFEYTIADTP